MSRTGDTAETREALDEGLMKRAVVSPVVFSAVLLASDSEGETRIGDGTPFGIRVPAHCAERARAAA